MLELEFKTKFKNIKTDLKKYLKIELTSKLNTYGQWGIDLLEEATPKRTGLTSKSWIYDVKKIGSQYILSFSNTNIQNGENIAVIIDNGRVTKNGTWVDGEHYIEPTIDTLIKKIIVDIGKEV